MRNVDNPCMYFVCKGLDMVAMYCAAGSSVPDDYIRTSGLNPCTKQGHDVCGTCGMRMRAGVAAPCDWWWTQRLRAEPSCRGTQAKFRKYGHLAIPDTSAEFQRWT